MKRKNILIFLSIISLTSCFSANNSSTDKSSNNISSSSSNKLATSESKISSSVSNNNDNTKKYTITWKNFDGSVLEVDNDVTYGSLPSYDGAIPTKNSNDNSYVFNSWSPALTEVKEDKTYTASFILKYNGENKPGIVPHLSNDNKNIQYGFYPQSYVSDSSLISSLNNLDAPKANGWYLYEGNYYVKEIAQTFKGSSYVFNDGTTISNGKEYWFKCEPINWNILKKDNKTYSLVSSMLLDVNSYYKDYSQRIVDDKIIYANDYKESDIRKWINEDFYTKAFSLNNTNVLKSLIDNTTLSTNLENNQFICESTYDNVYLLSYQDYLKIDDRVCNTTDYVRAKGAWCNLDGYSSSYWTRTPSSEYDYCAWNVNSGGYLSEYAVDGNSHTIRPALSIII